MATCGHCKQTGQTVAHVRSCGQGAVVTAERQLPELSAGNVVTVADQPGFWEVEATLVNDEFQAAKVQARGRTCALFHLGQVELVFPTLNAAADYRLAAGALTAQEQISEALHGDPLYCRGCAKGWRGAQWHRDGCVNVPAAQPLENNHHASGATLRGQSTPVWEPVNELRNAVKEHLHYESKSGGRHKREGRFAIVVDGTTKFLRIKLMLSGNYAGRVFVDSQASDDHYPVKAPATLTTYLTAVLADPEAAAKRYADELDACSRCGRTLTNDESRARGIGPECWAKSH